MKKQPIVLGKTDPDELKDPRVAWFHSDEFQDKLLQGMREAKDGALRKQEKAADTAVTDAAKH